MSQQGTSDTESERGTQRESTQSTTRRRVLRGAAAGAAALTGVTASAGTAVAGDWTEDSPPAADAPADYPRVSAREHFDDDANLINGETTYSYDTAGDWGKYHSPGDELCIFVHGWNVDEQGAMDTAYEAELAMAQNGYDWGVFNVLFTWDSDKGDSPDMGWSDAREIARDTGEKLANFIQSWDATHDVPIRLIGHSLGGSVVCEAVESLYVDHADLFGTSSPPLNVVDNVAFLGAAVDDQAVSTDGEYGEALYHSVVEVNNYVNNDDQVLDDVYETREWTPAIGEEGADAPEPDNYFDRNVSDIVDLHGDYYRRDVGCMGEVVSRF